MNADRVINKINIEMNAFNESGSREDKACAEGLRRARTYIQLEVLKRKILTHDQQVVLEWFKNEKKTQPFATVADFFAAYFEGTEEVPLNTMVSFEQLSTAEQFQVLAAFAEWGMANE